MKSIRIVVAIIQVTSLVSCIPLGKQQGLNHDNPTQKALGVNTAPYIHVGERAGRDAATAMHIFVYTPSRDSNSLQKIINDYNAIYDSAGILHILFFDNEQIFSLNVERDWPDMSDAAYACQFARYIRNKHNGYNVLKYIRR